MSLYEESVLQQLRADTASIDQIVKAQATKIIRLQNELSAAREEKARLERLVSDCHDVMGTMKAGREKFRFALEQSPCGCVCARHHLNPIGSVTGQCVMGIGLREGCVRRWCARCRALGLAPQSANAVELQPANESAEEHQQQNAKT